MVFDALKMGWRQDKEGFVLTLRVEPHDAKACPELGQADVGTPLKIIAITMDDDGNPSEPDAQ